MCTLRCIINANKKHLEESGETYWDHCISSLNVFLACVVATQVLFIHAFIPMLFKNQASRLLQDALDFSKESDN